MEQLALFKEKENKPEPIFSGVAPARMRRITWRSIPLCRWTGFYRGRVTWARDDLIQVIITHTPCGYDLGWRRLICPAEVVCVKK